MSLFAKYLDELMGDHIVETDKGFATYRYPDTNTVYILDIFVLKDFRQEGIASALADTIVEVAKKRGCTRVLGSVVPSRNGATTNLKVLLAYGFRLESCSTDFILLRKDI